MDHTDGEELLGVGEAVEGTAVGCPIDSIDGVVCPGGVFSQEVFAEAAGAEGVS